MVTENNPRTVLVVEDEALVRMALAMSIEDAGFSVLEAKDADQAIELLENRPDIRLVVTDVQMPGTMDGVKLAYYIRDRWPPIHLILVSAEKAYEASIPSGARFFLKPYSDHIIVAEAQSLLAG